MSQDNELNRVRYEYTKNSELKLEYAHGVWGGINPQGEIEINFYTESDKLPPSAEYIIAPDGNIASEVLQGNAEPRTIVRNIHSKILINAQTAKGLYTWLEDKLETLHGEQSPIITDIHEPKQ